MNVATISRFPYPSPDRLKTCAAVSDRVEELAETFPLAFFLLATRYGTLESRQNAIRLAVDGRPLAEVAAALTIPCCLRRLPPEACRDRLPVVAWSRDASRILGDRIPADPAHAAAWLPAIFFAAAAADEDFAFWLSKQRLLFEGPRLPAATFIPLALYAWASRHAEGPLRRLVYTPWHPRMRLGKAALEARNWLNRVKLEAYLGTEGLADPWIHRAYVDDFEFVPLTTAADVQTEAIAMSNCLDAYAERLACNRCRVFSVRLRGTRIAALEIEPIAKVAPCDMPAYVLSQLKGPYNCDVPEDVWRATWDWLKLYGKEAPHHVAPTPRPALDQRLASALAPYVASRTATGLDWSYMLSPSKLHASILALARRAGLPHSIMLFG